MTKVTVKESAAPAVADQKPRFESIVDSQGRTIQLRTLDPLQKARVVMAVGGEAAGNGVYMGAFAFPAASVVFIDDTPFGVPQSLKQIEAILAELGAVGMDAIEKHLMGKHEAEKEAAEVAATSAAVSAEQAAAKN